MDHHYEAVRRDVALLWLALTCLVIGGAAAMGVFI
jgi:hypothetical protein